MNVLLVDDEPLELEQLEYLIQPLFPLWRLYKAADATQAMAISQQNKIQLAFLDINLPGKSGLQFGEELRQLYPDIQLIIVSAHHNFQYAKQSIRLRVVDYITKPIIQSELIEVLSPFVSSSLPNVRSKGIHDALAVIHERFAEKLNLLNLASEVHMNPTYLSRLFHDEVGVSFSEYLIQYRIKYAKQLLTTQQDWNIASVAEKAGFNSHHYFCAIFRKMVGQTPKKYREMGK